MKGLVEGLLSVGGLGPLSPPLKSGPVVLALKVEALRLHDCHSHLA